MRNPPTATEAKISEIFSSLQGEGTHLGEKHIFIRFEECNIHCSYCDELDKPAVSMTIDQVMDRVKKLEKEKGPHTFVSLTGGEPLIYLTFIRPLIARLRAENLKVYLETAGILWKALQEVIAVCDCVAMDMKPASVTGEKNFYDEHYRFLQIASHKETFIKVVLSKDINMEEFDELVKIAASVDPKIPFILQPISGKVEGHEDPELMDLLDRLQRRAGEKLASVRMVPRLHRILKIN